MFGQSLTHSASLFGPQVQRLVFFVFVVISEVNLHFLMVDNVDTGYGFPDNTAEKKINNVY